MTEQARRGAGSGSRNNRAANKSAANNRVCRVDSPDAVAELAAAAIAELLTAAVRDRGRASLAVSGGSTPRATLAALVHTAVAWELVDVFQVDERIAPDGDPERNINMVHDAFLTPLAATGVVVPAVHPMPVTDLPVEDAAGAYADSLPDRLDVVQLGLGGDGHTASLIPGDLVLTEVSRPVAITGDYHGTRRMTLTAPAINEARHRVWIVTGESKADALQQMLDRDQEIPATLVFSDDDAVFTDIERDSA